MQAIALRPLMYVIISNYPAHQHAHLQSRKCNRRPGRCATPARHPVHRASEPMSAKKDTAIRGKPVTLQAAADALLSAPRCGNLNTRRAYATVIDKLITQLDPARELTRPMPAVFGSR
jgi:hypothetical protein